MSSKKYYVGIDLIRVIAFLAILLYHLNILKGGYLAVCTFFCLSGYLSCISAFKKDKFSLLSYYSNRLLKLYIPLIVVVFITIFVVNLLPDISWLNLKPETTSVLFGYNNFWQLGANLDYFAMHINSPFIHLWYISILLQFDLIFPFIYMILKKIGDKIHKSIPCIIMIVLSFISCIYFYKMNMSQNIMGTYYNTFSRLFSILFGVTLGFIHSYAKPLIPTIFKNKYISKIIYIFYLIVLILLFIFIDAKSPYFGLSMILTTLITCRLIDYSVISLNNKLSIHNKFIKFLSSISYEIYLVQYPVIYLIQYLNINDNLKILLIIILIFIISWILHVCVNFRKKEKNKIFKWLLRLIVLIITLYGLYQYILTEDHTKEMKQLEQQLIENEKIIAEKQKEYELQFKQEYNDWMTTLKDLENAENELRNVVTNLQIVGIGDSVMLSAIENLYNTFPNGYFDAKISRTAWVAKGIMENLESKNILGNIIIFNLGANGDCTEECKIEIMEKCKNRKVFWINVTNDKDVRVNEDLISLASKYNNLYIIDWYSISKEHPEYFISDKIHLTDIGKEVYTKLIYDSIYEVYSEEYNKKKEEIIKQHEEQLKNKISLYGNDILLNVFDYIKDDYVGAKFSINKEYNYEILINDIKKSIQDNTLTHKIVFVFDENFSLDLEQYKNLIELCNGHEIYILSLNGETTNLLLNTNYQNVKVINFYQKVVNNNNYLIADKVHLSEEGNKALSETLKITIG